MMMRLGWLIYCLIISKAAFEKHVQHDVLIITQDIIPSKALAVRVNLSGF